MAAGLIGGQLYMRSTSLEYHPHTVREGLIWQLDVEIGYIGNFIEENCTIQKFIKKLMKILATFWTFCLKIF
jgi:hypothetical protein